ncbi:MAG: CvpA family protein [Roseiflexaceae bacterium]
MVIVDIAILLLVVVFTTLGFYWGAIRQLLAIIGLLASFVVAGRYGMSVAALIEPSVANRSYAMLIAVMLIMMAVNGCASLAASLIQQFAGLIALGLVDHLLGALLGALQALLVVVGLLLVMAAFPHQTWMDALRMSNVVNGMVYVFGGVVLTFIPDPLQSALRIVIFR